MVLLVFYKYGFFIEFGDLLSINSSSSHSDLTSIEVLLTIMSSNFSHTQDCALTEPSGPWHLTFAIG